MTHANDNQTFERPRIERAPFGNAKPGDKPEFPLRGARAIQGEARTIQERNE